MSKLIATRGQQYPLVAEFTFNFDDTMVDINGALKDFKTVGSTVVDAINLPTGAIVIGGEVVTETTVGGSTAYNVSVGDSDKPGCYLNAADRVSSGRTALNPSGYVVNGKPIRVTVAPTVAEATSGKVTVRVQYIVRNRVNETQTY